MITNNGVNVTPIAYQEDMIKILEEYYDAQYILESEFYFQSGWSGNLCGLIFYQANPRENHSNYFVIYFSNIHNCYMIIDGLPTIKNLILDCITRTNSEIYQYSHYRHHYNQFDDQFYVAIDGGRRYTRLIGDIKHIIRTRFKIEKNELIKIKD